MSKITARNFSANETEIDQLLRENAVWKVDLSNSAEEITFLKHFLSADVFAENLENLEQQLQSFRRRLEDFRNDNMELGIEVHNHRYDIEGMMECEDIGCERFYHDEHVKLEEQVRIFLKSFKAFKLEVFSYSGNVLRKKR